MNVRSFNSAFDALYQQVHRASPDDINLSMLRYQTARFLDALGHCEFDIENRYIYVCPPVLALLPSYGLPKAVLTGARNPDLIANLKNFTKKHKDVISYFSVTQSFKRLLIPSSVYLEATDKTIVQEAASYAKIDCNLDQPAAWLLIKFWLLTRICAQFEVAQGPQGNVKEQV
jgi:hypothetical protein